ncbi:binding-protein-dependent transport system inner membrane protein [Planococcus antarcticus DSM 14505]|uniref:ABC transporter permease n=1 Tax=Planococcus antarcticus DSM 14505 TaxID=1185653 RepID=A0A1C7DIG6_9BACL|nr:ABC transporter permease subunit [Planococcus antarcticus]ANU11013.1 ABC transporter permease [Planococcus antarcticus DSM 14505]EIM07056.1 binding-protein-dependent transport system inner membrane protein [Planococcus antarcticus DSM 14505]
MWQKTKPYLLLLPTIGTIVLLFFGGLFDGLLKSFGYFPAIGETRFETTAYADLFRSSEFWESLVLTLRVAALSSVIAAVLGAFIAISLFMLNKLAKTGSAQFWHRLFQLPLTIPHLVGGYIIVLLFMQSGFLSKILASAGLIDKITDFPVLVNDPFGWGIILTYAWKEAPFVSLMIYPVLSRIHRSWRDVARVFGAGSWQFIREIVLPVMLPAWTIATFVVFVFTFSAFEVPFLLGVTYPSMLPVYSYQLYTSGTLADRPEALAVNIVLAVLTILLGLVVYYFSKRWNVFKGWD